MDKRHGIRNKHDWKEPKWELADLPSGKGAIGLKWVYKTKFSKEESILNARLPAKDYSQHPRIDFNEIFAPFGKNRNYTNCSCHCNTTWILCLSTRCKINISK